MKIVLASVLKPVTEPRMLARLGRSLAELPGAEIHLVAHTVADAPTARPDAVQPNLWLHPLFAFPRLSWGRLLASARLLRTLRALHPDVLVVGAAELLPAALWWRWRTGGRVVYDVRENYALNLRTQRVFPVWLARPLAAAVTLVERFAAPRLAGALLAERVYADQLPWLPHCRRVAVIENKYQPPPAQPAPSPPAPSSLAPPAPDCAGPLLRAGRPLQLLVSGTLSELYGTFEAVTLADALQLAAPGFQFELHLVGVCPLLFHYDKLKTLALTRPWLKLTGGAQPVPHSQLVAAIRGADWGLLPYQAHPSLATCIPTKLWEYMGECLPVLVTPNPLWSALVAQHQAGFSLDFADAAAAARQLLAAVTAPPAGRYYPAGAPAEAFWAPEGRRLRAFFAALPTSN